MHDRIPEPLKALVEQLARLPGLGPKSAMRVAMTRSFAVGEPPRWMCPRIVTRGSSPSSS